MNEIKLSVIMSVFNGGDFLCEAVESILNQDFKKFEFIIIDDRSTDDSLEILKKYQKKDSRIVLIENKKNIGLTKSLNVGLKKSKGKYIARLDSDDISLKNRLKMQVDFLEKNKDIFLIGSGALNIDENSKSLGEYRPENDYKKTKSKLLESNCIYHSSVMFRNKGKILYREKFPYSQDYDLYLRLLSKGKKISNLSEILIKYRINPRAVSWTKSAKQKLFANKARDFYHQRLKDGKDDYDNFNPYEILNLDVENSKDKIVLRQEIIASFKLRNFKKTRKICRKYFKYHGILNKIFFYYLLSLTNSKFIKFLQKIKS
jgi:glycosyltransferase involved in cell wall biosynthesis